MLGRRSRRAAAHRVAPVAGRYARVLDGETLWLAVEGAPPTVTLRYDGGELVEPTEPETGAGLEGVVRARVPLGALADVTRTSGDLVVEVLAGDGRQAAPITWGEEQAPGPVREAIATRDRRWRWRVTAPDGHLGLVRGEVAPGIPVARVTPHDDGRGVRLDLLAPGAAVDVRADEHTVLAPGERAALTRDGLPLVRAHDDLRRPHHAVALPVLGDGLRLRWQPDGRLAVSRDRRDAGRRRRCGSSSSCRPSTTRAARRAP